MMIESRMVCDIKYIFIEIENLHFTFISNVNIFVGWLTDASSICWISYYWNVICMQRISSRLHGNEMLGFAFCLILGESLVFLRNKWQIFDVHFHRRQSEIVHIQMFLHTDGSKISLLLLSIRTILMRNDEKRHSSFYSWPTARKHNVLCSYFIYDNN